MCRQVPGRGLSVCEHLLETSKKEKKEKRNSLLSRNITRGKKLIIWKMRTKIEMFNSNKQCSETDKKIRWIGGRKYRKKDADIERKIQT
jgi:hypothetical protein